jgi:uroporphyrin-III C-methyltransferase/precorrin-2 dehydrogenase/sirohydrochlorin ferrochelatase
MAVGFVSIVGAGPGDPDLLTLKAAKRLAEADLVLYDALVEPAVLALAPHAQKFFVGKRAHRKAVSQETIHWLMIRAARRGRRVVRLKGGDPFVLGRGGEEALALGAAGIPFEIVPGVSNAIAAPALAGIPVTHRRLTSGFLVVSGHGESAYGPVVDGVAPNSVTLVVLMGLGSRAALAERLIGRGWRRSTPTAVILAASTSRESVWTGSLAELAEAPVDLADPGTIVVGDVVSLRATIAGAVRDLALESDAGEAARRGA